jgi:hypothetical protein
MRIRLYRHCRSPWFLAGVAFLAAAACLFLLLPGSKLTQANLERIELGMTLGEVESLLGGPAQSHEQMLATVEGPAMFVMYPWSTAKRNEKQHLCDIFGWHSFEATIKVYVAEDGKVVFRHGDFPTGVECLSGWVAEFLLRCRFP